MPAFWRAHWLQVVGLFVASGPAGVLALVLWWCVPSFCPLSRFVFGALYLNVVLFRVFRGFSGFYGVRVGLCCLGALRGLWGFCVREWLGGLKACGVFASLFVLLPFFFFSCVCLLLCPLSFFALVVFLCSLALSLWLFGCGCCFLFPFGLYAKRKDAKVLPLASSLVLLWCVVLDVLKHYRYFLRFIVPVSITVAGDSCHIFRLFRWVVYYLPVFVNR